MAQGTHAPTAYQPTGQGAADQNYQGLVNNATPWASALPQQVIPGLNTAATNVVNNPYYQQAQAGAQAAAGQATSTVAPGQFAGSAAMNQAGAAGTPLTAQTTYGAQLAPADLAMILQSIPGLTGGMGAANQVLQTGFDPQRALYDQQAQKTQDSSNATNAMYGLSQSPYGAGVANQNQTNFNIDWQNQQLQRQIAALSAYGTEQGVVANNLTNLNSNAVNSFNSLNSGAAQNYATTTGAQGQAYATGSNLGRAGLQTLTDASSAPSATYLAQQQAGIQALSALASGAGSALAPSGALAASDLSYLGVGQNATTVNQNAYQMNNKAAQANLDTATGLAGVGSGAGQTSGLDLAGTVMKAITW